jgi:hypothetical protein
LKSRLAGPKVLGDEVAFMAAVGRSRMIPPMN